MEVLHIVRLERMTNRVRQIRVLAAVVASVIAAGVGYRLLVAPLIAPEKRGLPPAFGPAGNGLVAFSVDGDIFVGDPVAGTSTAIVTGPSNDTTPTFSPDGKRIAFVRADSMDDASILVVRPDGSDMQTVMADGFTKWIPGFAWTPDGTSILLNHDAPGTRYFDGLLSLVDAAGVGEPRRITPPLPAQIGYTYFSIYAAVAPMFRPPKGDVLVSSADGILSVIDLNGTNVGDFVPPALTEFQPVVFTRPAWSPDGSQIAFDLSRDVSRSSTFEEYGLFVINAEGGDLRRFEIAVVDRAWSPDGSKIAIETRVAEPEASDSVIVILGVETGEERILQSTTAIEKDMADPATDPDAFRTSSVRTYHRYAYEGWSWTPDGRSIVVVERHGTRPFLVDIETDGATELPWVTDGAASFQRVGFE